MYPLALLIVLGYAAGQAVRALVVPAAPPAPVGDRRRHGAVQRVGMRRLTEWGILAFALALPSGLDWSAAQAAMAGPGRLPAPDSGGLMPVIPFVVAAAIVLAHAARAALQQAVRCARAAAAGLAAVVIASVYLVAVGIDHLAFAGLGLQVLRLDWPQARALFAERGWVVDDVDCDAPWLLAHPAGDAPARWRCPRQDRVTRTTMALPWLPWPRYREGESVVLGWALRTLDAEAAGALGLPGAPHAAVFASPLRVLGMRPGATSPASDR